MIAPALVPKNTFSGLDEHVPIALKPPDATLPKEYERQFTEDVDVSLVYARAVEFEFLQRVVPPIMNIIESYTG